MNLAEKEEMFDIVDENNSIIGKEMRSIVHKGGLLHRSVHVIVFNSEGEIFLQKRTHKKLIAPSVWDLSAAEHLEQGEDYRKAVLRGLREELSINVNDVTELRSVHIQKFEYNDGKTIDNELVKFYKTVYDGEIKIDPNEVAEGRFFTVDEIKQMVKENPDQFSPWFLEEWEWMEENKTV